MKTKIKKGAAVQHSKQNIIRAGPQSPDPYWLCHSHFHHGPELLIATVLLLSVNYIVSHFAKKKDKEENDKLAPVCRQHYLRDMASESASRYIALFKELSYEALRQEHRKIYDGRSNILRLWQNVRYINS